MKKLTLVFLLMMTFAASGVCDMNYDLQNPHITYEKTESGMPELIDTLTENEPEEPAFLRLRKILGLGDDPAAHGAHVLTLHTVELRQPLLQIVRRGHVSVGRQRIIQVRPAAVDVGVGRISDLPQDMPQLIRVRSLPEFLHGCHAFPPFKRWAVCRSGTLPNHVRRTANTYTRQQR